MVEAIRSNTLPVALLNKFNTTEGLSPADIVLTALLTELAEYFNITNGFTAAQQAQTIELILTDPDAKNLKPEDFRVIFNNAKKGVYGTIYNRLDGQVVFGWIRAYAAERIEYCAHNSLQLHGALKTADNLIAPEVVEMYKEHLRLLRKDVQELDIKPVVREKKVIQKSDRDRFIQSCFTEFDKLVGEEIGGVRFTKYNGKQLDQVEYATERVKEYDKQQIEDERDKSAA